MSEDELIALLMDRDGPGVFTRTLGFGTGTHVIKGVHVMNDLAQVALGGRPSHNGDLLARVIREEKREGGEDNSDSAMRTASPLGEVYGRAFPPPPALSVHRRTLLRSAIGELVHHDGGVYRPGTSMASGLVTHSGLLGAEGFTRFGVGRYLHDVLGPEGQERVRALYSSATDPYSRALAPLIWSAELTEGSKRAGDAPPPSPFDEALGARLTTLLTHPLAKPHILRLFLHVATLGLFLKVMGVGRAGGRPTILATTAADVSSSRLLRGEATASVRAGVAALDDALARTLAADLTAADRATSADDATQLLREVRGKRASDSKLYLPDKFVVALAARAGMILPRTDRAGWGRHLALTSDAVEALTLMYVPPGARPIAWRALWDGVATDLGLYIGADTYGDACALRDAGVTHVHAEELERNQANILALATRRGVARHLPDGGAEAGGELL